MSRRLIVNAVDYGFTEGVCRGIREAHLRGIVSSTSAMMNTPGVEKELMEAIKNTPRLGLGVHINLTAGYPLAEAEEIPTLVDEDGRFFQHKSFIEHLGLIHPDEARREWEEQIRYFVQITGRKPTHIDSHHHCSFLSPDLFRTMLMVAEKYQCAIRNIYTESPFTLSEDFLASKQDEINLWSQSIAEEYRIAQPNYFHSSFFGKSATSTRLMEIMRELPEGVTEVMCHPGFADDDLAQKTSYSTEREGELEILTRPDIISLVRNESIEIISFEDIQFIE